MNDIRLINVETYRAGSHLEGTNRVKVTLDMPVETYTEFRKVIEAPHLCEIKFNDPVPA